MSSKKIRLAKPEDAAALLEIYAPYVAETTVSFELVPPTEAEFSERIRHTLQRYPYLVAETDGKAVGYAYVSAFHGRPAYDWSVETSIYVARDRREGGVGTALYRVLEEILLAQGICNATACITYPNPASIAFHERMGYRHCAHFHACGYKMGQWRDVIWMEKPLSPRPEAPTPVRPVSALTLPECWDW